MGNSSGDLVDIGNVTSTKDVLYELQRLSSVLSDLELEQFKLFNDAYFVVTQNMQRARESNYFDNPDIIEKFIVVFAGYYFISLNALQKQSADVAQPWAMLNEYAKLKSPPKFLSLMLGANAHINNDLPQALHAILHQNKEKELLGDLVKLDSILMQSGKEIVGLFEEPNKMLNFLKRCFQFTYYRPAMYTILWWRFIAWKNYKRLQNGKSSTAVLSKRSTRIAKRLILLARILG